MQVFRPSKQQKVSKVSVHDPSGVNDQREDFGEDSRTMLHLANCLGKNEEILIENYKQALMSGRIDIEILSKAIGDGDLDMDLVLDH